jgi:hypothetical protein
MRFGTAIVLFIVSVCSVGCIAPIPLTRMGASGGTSAVSFENEGGGRGESFWIAKYDDVIAATLHTGEALSLELQEKRTENDQTFFRFYDGKKERIDLIIERRTDTMTSINFKVGWFGSVAFGRIVARQIIFELNKSESFLEDWTSEANN